MVVRYKRNLNLREIIIYFKSKSEYDNWIKQDVIFELKKNFVMTKYICSYASNINQSTMNFIHKLKPHKTPKINNTKVSFNLSKYLL